MSHKKSWFPSFYKFSPFAFHQEGQWHPWVGAQHLECMVWRGFPAHAGGQRGGGRGGANGGADGRAGGGREAEETVGYSTLEKCIT